MKSIVTGGSGFIGSHLVDILVENDHEVVIIDNLSSGNIANIKHLRNLPNVIFAEKDLNELDSQMSIFENTDYVFHLAGLGDIVPSIESPRKYFTANYMGTLNLLRSVQDLNLKKFVYALLVVMVWQMLQLQ